MLRDVETDALLNLLERLVERQPQFEAATGMVCAYCHYSAPCQEDCPYRVASEYLGPR